MRATFILSLFREDIVRALFWTLVHSLWQGMALAILTGLVIIFTRRSVPALRYNVLLGLFCLSLAAAGVTFFLQMRGAYVLPDGPAVVPGGVIPALPVETPAMSNLYAGMEQSWTDKLVGYLNQKADIIVAVWMIVLFVRLIKLAADLGAVQRLRYYRSRAVDERWRQRVAELAQRMGIKRVVELLESSLVEVPMMAGVFKPVILVPLGLLTQLPPRQVEAILLHELAHIRRKDYFVNLLQSIAEIIFFFNPAMLWISALIREERENCCDDIAVGESCSKKEYIHALVSFQEYRQSTSYVLAFAGDKNHLLERVKRIVHNDNKTLNMREKLFLLISVFITAGITMAYVQLSPVPVKPLATQVKAAGAVTSWSTAYEENAVNADTSKPGPVIKPDGGAKKAEIAPDTAVTSDQRQQAWERALAEQQRKLAEAQARLAEQELELTRQQDKLNDLYAEALARTQDLRDSVHGEKSSRVRLQEEQLRLDKVNELRLENQYRLQALQLERSERLLKGDRLKLENEARLKDLALKRSERELENAARLKDHLLLLRDDSGTRMNKYVEPVVVRLREKKLITQTDELTFSLDKNGLTVNGKKQPEEVFQDFKKAFLEDPQDFIYYSKKGGSESTTVNRHKD